MDVQAGSPSDEELMLATRRGNPTAFTQLYRRYQQKLYNFILRYTGDPHAAEDLFQETFLKLYAIRHQYEVKAAFSTLLYTIARNLCLDHIKALGRRKEMPQSLAYGPPGPSRDLADTRPHPLEQLETLQQEALLQRAVARLSEAERAVLILSRFQGLRYAEIAEILGMSVEAVKVRAHRALKTLREQLRP